MKAAYRRFFSTLLAFIFALAALTASGGLHHAAAEGKTETGYVAGESLFTSRYYTPDSLQAGCYPAFKISTDMALFNGPDVERIQSIQAELASGDASGTEWLIGRSNAQGGRWLDMYPMRMTKPGRYEWHVRAESEHMYLDKTYTMDIMDQKDDSEWVMPKYSVAWFAEPGQEVEGWEISSQASKLLPASVHLYSVGPKPDQGGKGSSNLTYSTPGQYSLLMMQAWGSFFTVTQVELLVYPKNEWYGKDESVVVKNYAELKEAINEKRANHILISPKFKYGKAESENLNVYGERTVTISPENDESAVIDGTLSFYGDGAVVLDRVSIESDTIGLDLGGGISVTAGRVCGGSAADSGGPAVTAWNSKLTIEEAIGGDGKTGIGGDGIYAMDGAVIEVRTARGGSAAAGVGGSGVIAMDGAKVTVTGEAVGGDGQIACGKGTLAGLNGEVELRGTAADGTLLESKKPVNPDEITSYALLQNALRNGKTDITLSPKFKITEKNWEDCQSVVPLFVSGDQLISISGPSQKKALSLNGTFRFICGRWKASGINLNYSKGRYLIRIGGNADVEWNGDLTASGNALNCVAADGSSCLTVNGNIVSSTKADAPAVVLNDSATVVINGNITEKGTTNAIVLRGGKLRINGDVLSTGNNYSAIYVAIGQLDLTGNVTSTKSECATIDGGGMIRIQGNITEKSSKVYALYVSTPYGLLTVDGKITATYPGFSTYDQERLMNNGELISR